MGQCRICGNYTRSNYLFCKECYQDVLQIYDDFSYYGSEYEIRNEYFDIRKKCQTYNLSEKKFDNYIMTMYALAELCRDEYESDYLIDRVEDDIDTLIDEFCDENDDETDEDEEEASYTNDKQSQNNNSDFNDKDYRNQWPREIQCEDGHYVRSKGEKIIDDWLYHHNIVHAYEKSVYMKSNPKDVVLSDFYIPKGDVYIEFWGMTDKPDYEARKKYKISLYDKNNYKRIDLEDSHINRIDDIMPRVLGKYDID